MLEFAKKLRAAWDALFHSRYVTHLEDEIKQLRGERERLLIELNVARNIARNPPPAPVVERKFPKFTPTKTSWEKYVSEQIALQEKEENGTPGTGWNDVDERQSSGQAQSALAGARS